jgi:ABC-type branched-subunit amino acid transport system substrate-binding protein
MTRRFLLRTTALVLVGALFAAGCGDDDDTASSTDTTAKSSTETTVKLTGTPVKIMVIYEGTGAVATPEVPEGAKGAAAGLNARGGVKGGPVEILECDAGNDANKAAECGRKAVSEGVVAVVGPVSANAGQYFPILEQAKIPVVGNVPASAADFTSADSFPIYGGIVTASAGLADVLVKQGAKKISIARIDLAAASAIGVFAGASLKRSNQTINKDVSIPVGAPDMATYVASALEGGTDGVLVGLSGQDATNFIIQLRQTNPNVKISATTTEFDAVVKALGDQAEGILVTAFFHNEQSSPTAWKAYTKDMEAAGFKTFSGFRTNSYAAVMVVASVLAAAPDATAAALSDALPKAQNIDVGLLPPLQFTKGGVGGVPRVFNSCGRYEQLDAKGNFKNLGDGFIDMFTGAPC